MPRIFLADGPGEGRHYAWAGMLPTYFLWADFADNTTHRYVQQYCETRTGKPLRDMYFHADCRCTTP